MNLKKILLLINITISTYTTYGQTVIEGTLPVGYVAIRESDAMQYKKNMENCHTLIEAMKSEIEQLIYKSLDDSVRMDSVNLYYKNYKTRENEYRKQLAENRKTIDQQKKTINQCSSRLDKQEYKKFVKKTNNSNTRNKK